MPFCFRLTLFVLACAFGAAAAEPVRKVTSVVRADARSGRLVRTVVVPSRVITAREVKPTRVDEPGAGVAAAPNPAIAAVIEETARKYAVDPLLVHSVISVESAWNPAALSHKGAQGLMQLIPSTARRFGVRNSWDVRQNIEGGVRYLKYLNTLFPNDLRLTLAAYNAGEAAVWKYGNNIPPYRETEQYVYKVGERYGRARRAAERSRPPEPPARTLAAVERYQPIEYFTDGEGRVHIRTKADDGSVTP